MKTWIVTLLIISVVCGIYMWIKNDVLLKNFHPTIGHKMDIPQLKQVCKSPKHLSSPKTNSQFSSLTLNWFGSYSKHSIFIWVVSCDIDHRLNKHCNLLRLLQNSTNILMILAAGLVQAHTRMPQHKKKLKAYMQWT